MTERLGRPDTSRFPPLAEPFLRTLPAGTLVGRIYGAGGRFPTTWRAFRSFGPTTARFDHQPPPPREHPARHITYVAPAIPGPTGDVYPVLKTCMAETYRDRGVVEMTRGDPYFALFSTTRDLRLLDLADTDWITAAGGNAAISSGLRSRAREWARAIYRHYGSGDAPEGLIYPPSNVPAARAIALWERAEDSLPGRPAFNEPLSHLGLGAAVETYAAELRLPLVA